MAGQAISSLHIQKLGHQLEEIRVRALHSLLSKLNFGFVRDKELVSRPEILKKLLEWFGFDAVSEEENVLLLILRILKADDDGGLLMLLKMPDNAKLLDGIRERLNNPKLLGLLEEIWAMVSNCQGADSTRPCSGSSSNVASSAGQTATTFELFIRESDGDQPCGASGDTSDRSWHTQRVPSWPGTTSATVRVPGAGLPWQPLCLTDQHVVAAVEDSLARSPDQACQFFCHVMLQDFPAEVFLQRPLITKMFLKLLEPSSTNKKMRSVIPLVVKCLYDLTNNLCIRVAYYTDPCMHSLKQEQRDDGWSVSTTPASQSARSDSCGEDQPTAGQYLQSCDLGQVPPGRPPGDSEDQLVLQMRQLGLPQFCLLALERVFPLVPSVSGAFPLVWSLVNLVLRCMSPELWFSTDPAAQEVMQLVKNVFSALGDAVEHCRLRCRLRYLQLLSVVPKLLSRLVVPDMADTAVAPGLRAALSDALLDYPLLTLHPRLHSALLQHLQMFSDPKVQERLQLYSDVTKLCDSVKTTAQFLKSSSDLNGKEFMSVVDSVLLSIPVLQNMTVVKCCIDIYFSKAHSWELNDEQQKQLSCNVLKILAHSELSVRLETYKACHRHVVAALGVSHVHHPVATKSVPTLFDTDILVELMCHGASSNNQQIQQYAEEILTHLLKGKFLMSDKIWKKFVEGLIPTLPLLLCYASKASTLGRVITKMLDPDISSTIYFPDFVVLKGNLCLLLSDQPLLREEAMARLVWLLTRQPQSSELLPELSSLSPVELSSILIVDEQFERFHTDMPKSFYQAGTLCQVLELLESPFVESVVRSSALTQVNVMLEDPLLHPVFIKNNGVDLILKIFHSAIVKKDLNHSPECVISIVNILRSLTYHNSMLRQELALQESLYFCILRAGLMFRDSQHHTARVAHVLCLLLYSDYLLPSLPPGHKGSLLSLPQLLVSSMRLPLHCSTHWRSSPHTSPSTCVGVMLKEEKVGHLLSHCWTAEWFGGVSVLLDWSSVQAVPDYSEELCLSAADLATLKLSAVCHTCKETLRAVQAAASHRSVHILLNTLAGYTWLQRAAPGSWDSWQALQWEETLGRFLTTRPACPEDEVLLAAVLDFLRLHLKVSPPAGTVCAGGWVSRGLRAPLLWVLEGVGGESEPSRELCRAALQLCEDCPVQGWAPVIQDISSCLRRSDSQRFYNLALLAWMLSCLTHVTSRRGWSNGASSVEWQGLAGCLCGLVLAFHCGSNAGSFMGLSITRSSVLCMNHLLAEMLDRMQGKEWSEVWQQTLGESYQLWLPSLWQCRDPVVRAGSLQLLAGLCLSASLCTTILATFDLLSMASCFVVDHQEASLVRERAAILLTNIISHKKHTTSSSSDRDTLQASPLQDWREVQEKWDLYGAVGTVLSRLYLAETLVPGYTEAPPCRWRVESMSGRKLSPHHSRPGDEVILVCEVAPAGTADVSSKPESDVSSSELEDVDSLMVSTPGLVAACCWLVVNLLAVDETHALASSVQHGFIIKLFRCLDMASSLQEERSTFLRRDLLEMMSAACSVLCKCVGLSAACRASVLRLPGCLHILLLLLRPDHYRTDDDQMVLQRNSLWSEVLRLLSALLGPADQGPDEGFRAVCSALQRCGPAFFLRMVKLSLAETAPPALRDSSLLCLTALLVPEVADIAVTQRTSVVDGSSGDATPHASVRSLLDECSGDAASSATSHASNAVGGELCELLVQLLERQRARHRDKCWGLSQGAVVPALSSLLAVSHSAKQHALQRELHLALVSWARELQARVALESARCLRLVSSRNNSSTRACPALDDLRVLLDVLTNLMVGSSSVKVALVQAGLPDVVHKVWAWCLAVPAFLADTLRLLCTLTTDCPQGSHSLVLTTAVLGVVQRSSSSAASLLHEIVSFVLKELELVSRSYNQQALALAFQLLRNTTHSQQCRILLAKGSLLEGFLLLHPSRTKGSKCWGSVEVMWLHFLADFTCHTEGQLALPKVQDLLQLLLWQTSCSRPATRFLSLVVLRNITFHQANRPLLLASAEFVQLLRRLLDESGAEERGMAGAMVWALVANNQKAKLVLKCSGLAVKLHEALNQLRVTQDHCDTIRVLEYVLHLLGPDKR